MTNKYNTVLYVGVTNNLPRRVYEHKEKIVEGFTKQYNLTKLVYYEIFDEPTTAIKREKSLKNLLRNKKEKLIHKKNPLWEDLYMKILSG